MIFAELTRRHRQHLGFCVPEEASLSVLIDEDAVLPPKSWLLPKTSSALCPNTTSARNDISKPDDLYSNGIEYLMIPSPDSSHSAVRNRFRRTIQKKCMLVAELPLYGEIYFLGSVHLSRPTASRRVVAILAAYNEARFIEPCLENLISQDVKVYLLDNGSTDKTVSIAEKWLGRGLINIEHLARNGNFQLKAQLKRKQELTNDLEADWFIHVDADEILEPPPGDWNLAEAISAVEEAGYSMVNFQEYTFVPTREFPDHDHSDYQRTMRHYYPFAKQTPFGIRAWKNGSDPLDLVKRGGHRPTFSGMRLCPVFFIMKHYQFLSTMHAISRYHEIEYDPDELDMGWHGGQGGWRDQFVDNEFCLPSTRDLRAMGPEQELDASQPWREHFLEKLASTSNRASKVTDAESDT